MTFSDESTPSEQSRSAMIRVPDPTPVPNPTQQIHEASATSEHGRAESN